MQAGNRCCAELAEQGNPESLVHTRWHCTTNYVRDRDRILGPEQQHNHPPAPGAPGFHESKAQPNWVNIYRVKTMEMALEEEPALGGFGLKQRGN